MFRVECWRLQPMGLPRLWRHCPPCRRTQAFVCSERFRMNAQKKIVDVWLLYRCSECGDTWKLPLHARVPIARLDPGELEGFERNDTQAAHRHARDVSVLRPHAVRIDAGNEASVVRTVLDEARNPIGDCIEIEVLGLCDLRLDRLVARELRVSRSALHRRASEGLLVVSPHGATALRHTVRHGQQLCFRDGFAALLQSGQSALQFPHCS